MNRARIIRYAVILLLSVLISHYLSYGKLPVINSDYAFPLQAFIIVTVFGVFICETNTMIYRVLDTRIPYGNGIAKRLTFQYGLTLSSTALVFNILYFTINMWLLGISFNFFTYSYYMLVCLFISAFETSVFSSIQIWKGFQADHKWGNGISQGTGYLKFKSNTKILNIPHDNIAYIQSMRGIVTIVEMDKRHHISNFTSFKGIPSLPTTLFFRINRQLIINHKIIRRIESASYRKIRLYLEQEFMNGFDEIIISRYKSAEFKRWFQNQ